MATITLFLMLIASIIEAIVQGFCDRTPFWLQMLLLPLFWLVYFAASLFVLAAQIISLFIFQQHKKMAIFIAVKHLLTFPDTTGFLKARFGDFQKQLCWMGVERAYEQFRSQYKLTNELHEINFFLNLKHRDFALLRQLPAAAAVGKPLLLYVCAYGGPYNVTVVVSAPPRYVSAQYAKILKKNALTRIAQQLGSRIQHRKNRVKINVI